jgi:hypothetical protein
MGERWTSSQVSVVCRSHGWLEVEEERECSSWEEKEESQSRSDSAPREDLALPFIRQGVGYISWEREKEKRLCMHNICKRGRSFPMQRSAVLGLLLPYVMTLDTWCMHTSRGRFPACRKWLVREVMEVVFGHFPSNNNSRNTSWFGAVFLHENKSRKPPKNMLGVVVDMIVARNHCLWVPLILGPVRKNPCLIFWIKLKVVSVAFMLMHLDASWVQKVSKNEFRCCPNPFENFPDFFGIYYNFPWAYSIY